MTIQSSGLLERSEMGKKQVLPWVTAHSFIYDPCPHVHAQIWMFMMEEGGAGGVSICNHGVLDTEKLRSSSFLPLLSFELWIRGGGFGFI